MKYIITILFVVIGFISMAQPKVGEHVPNILIKSTDGKQLSLKDQKAKVILIDFWASWCMPCRAAIKKLKPIYEAYKGKGFDVFAVSLDENVADWKAAIKADKTTWVHGIDGGGWYGKIASEWKIESIPNTYLIDENGVVLAKDPTEAQIEKILAKKLGNSASNNIKQKEL